MHASPSENSEAECAGVRRSKRTRRAVQKADYVYQPLTRAKKNHAQLVLSESETYSSLCSSSSSSSDEGRRRASAANHCAVNASQRASGVRAERGAAAAARQRRAEAAE